MIYIGIAMSFVILNLIQKQMMENVHIGQARMHNNALAAERRIKMLKEEFETFIDEFYQIYRASNELVEKYSEDVSSRTANNHLQST